MTCTLTSLICAERTKGKETKAVSWIQLARKDPFTVALRWQPFHVEHKDVLLHKGVRSVVLDEDHGQESGGVVPPWKAGGRREEKGRDSGRLLESCPVNGRYGLTGITMQGRVLVNTKELSTRRGSRERGIEALTSSTPPNSRAMPPRSRDLHSPSPRPATSESYSSTGPSCPTDRPRASC